MTFSMVEGQPRQSTRPRLALEIPEVDLSALHADAARSETVRWATLHARWPFDLERGPLVRAALLRWSSTERVLLLNMHHIVSDGWSLGVLLAEVGALYPAFLAGRPSPLPELTLQYPDYAWWQRNLLQGEVLGRQLAFWTGQLADAPPALDLPGSGSRPPVIRSNYGATHRFRLPAELATDLKTLSRRQGATLFMTLLAGFAALLNRYSGARDLMIGIPVAGRNRPELERLIGFFVNTLVVRVQLDGAPGGEELLRRVRRSSLDAFSHQDLPFERLVAELNPERDLDRSPLFQVMFALQNAPTERVDLPGLSLSRFEIDTGTIRFELYLELTEDGDELEGAVQLSLDLFDLPFALRLVDHFRTLLQGLVARPADEVAGLPLLSEPEQAQILREWNDTACDLPLEVPFQRLFADIVARHPGRIAAVCQDRCFNYAELDGRSNAVARHLEARGVGPETIVAILAERGLDFLTAVVGVFKAGAAYLPLDPRHPEARMRQVLEQSRSPMVLAAGALLPLVTEAAAGLPGEPPAICELEPLVERGSTAAGPLRGGAGNAAYVIFTSGSTGVPKGALLTQRGLVNHLYAMILGLELSAESAVAQTASQCFDISVWQFLAPLLTGGRVEIYPDAVAHDPAALLDRTDADGVTVLEIVPSLLRLMLEEIRRRGAERPSLRSLRWLIPTGEAVPPELCREWHAVYPDVVQVNGYGPAECSDDVSLHRIVPSETRDGRTVSIGRPVEHTEIYVLDGGHRPVSPRVAGELCIGGSGVGRGYLFDPAKTAAAFVPDPFSGRPGDRIYRTGDLARFREDGLLEFLGRFDHQVKIRGFRLELGEIEAVLGEHPALSTVVVMARPDASGAQRLVAYFEVRAESEAPSPQELRDFLKKRLPDYAVPSAWMHLDRLPLSPNGKVDRRALPDIEGGPAQDRPYVAPRSDLEAVVADVFAAVIGAEKVGALDNFFEIGGHSLLATQAIWKLREALGVELALRTLFEAPTVAELAGFIEDRIIEQIESMSEDEVDLMLDDNVSTAGLASRVDA
jgi:amino acid adenylation domain-containing protein